MMRRIRKTGELIDVISWTGDSIRDEKIDTVSYVDSKDVEHPCEKMNFYWDTTGVDTLYKPQDDFDWDKYRYEIIKSIYPACIEKYGFHHVLNYTIAFANDLIEKLKSEKDGGVQGV